MRSKKKYVVWENKMKVGFGIGEWAIYTLIIFSRSKIRKL
jgi:hypothetical protein